MTFSLSLCHTQTPPPQTHTHTLIPTHRYRSRRSPAPTAQGLGVPLHAHPSCGSWGCSGGAPCWRIRCWESPQPGSCSHAWGVVPALSPWVLHPTVPPHSPECSCSRCPTPRWANFRALFILVASYLILCFKSRLEIEFNWRNENLLQKEIFRKLNLL